MKLIDAHAKLLTLKQEILQTSDVAAALRITNGHASQLLTRLARAGFFVPLMKGVWACHREVDPFLLPEYLTYPMPSYVSFHTALYLHGMISQIPATVYAASLARARQYKTPLAHVSVHRIQPDFFFGFDVVGRWGVKIATPEKALLDFFYLTFAKSSLFRRLPELEIPKNFKTQEALKMIERIPSLRIRTLVRNKFRQYGIVWK